MKLSKKKEKDFAEKIRKIKELEQQKKQAETEIDELKGEIKDFMEAKGAEELNVDIFTVRYADVTAQKFDSTAFKKTHSELYQQYLKKNVSKRFTIV